MHGAAFIFCVRGRRLRISSFNKLSLLCSLELHSNATYKRGVRNATKAIHIRCVYVSYSWTSSQLSSPELLRSQLIRIITRMPHENSSAGAAIMPSILFLSRDTFSVGFLWKCSALVLLMLLGGSHANQEVSCSICDGDEIAFPDYEVARFVPLEFSCYGYDCPPDACFFYPYTCPCESTLYYGQYGALPSCQHLEKAGFWDRDEPVTITSATCQDLQDALDTITIPGGECSDYHFWMGGRCCEKGRENPIWEIRRLLRISNYPLIEILGYLIGYLFGY